MSQSVKIYGARHRTNNGCTFVIHTLEMIAKNWYLELEMHRDTTDWDYMTQRFKVTLTFENESQLLYAKV
jgi:hypothetical protein